MTTNPEIPERRSIGQELADALGLIDRIKQYLTGYADDDRAECSGSTPRTPQNPR